MTRILPRVTSTMTVTVTGSASASAAVTWIVAKILAETNSHYNTAQSDLLLRPINSTVEYDFTCQSVLFTHILI